jgi:hypothetical protein
MIDRLRVADLKDEIVSMQAELNNALFEQHQKSQMTLKSEPVSVQPQLNQTYHHPIPQNPCLAQSQQNQIQPQVMQVPVSSTRPQTNVCNMQEPSQILKAKQEQKLHENIKNDRVKIEVPEIKTSFSSQSVVIPCLPSPTVVMQKQSKFDKLKNESLNIVVTTHHGPSISQHPLPQLLSPNTKSHINTKPPIELKQEELDDFDIESEIRPNLIMKKCESIPSPGISHNATNKKQPKTKEKEKEREFSPLNDYFNTKVLPKASKSESVKSESNDASYDEWLSIHKELNIQLTVPNHSLSNKKKEGTVKCIKTQTKLLENDLSDIFEHHDSPKSVEKQLDDLFSSASNKSSDMLATASPLTEFFHVETSNINEKSVENRLEALFGTSEDDSRKSNQQDLVETRLEQLFQGSVAENDESALDNASFLYKSTEMTYDMIQKQIHVSTSSGDSENGNSSNPNKRQWSGACDMFESNNSSILFPAPSSPSSKRACTGAASSVAFDNKWIEDSFDFASEIMSTESSGDDITKHRSWNGNLDHTETMIGIQSPHQSQFHLPSGDVSNIQQHQNPTQNLQQTEPHLNLMERQDQLMGSQISNMNYDDVDDISRQVQNAIDSILNLQSSDPLHYQLDSSFLELNTITDPSASPNSSVSMQPSHSHQGQNSQHLSQPYQMHSRSDNQINPHHSFNIQKTLNMPKRKYSRMDDIGDCLIGGSNLDDSPSGLALPEAHNVDQSSACVGEFVNNLLNCEEKSITTS